MDKIRIGISFSIFPADLPPGSWFADRARQIEALGFDSLWHGERLLTAAPFLDPVAFLGHAAAVTSRIKLGTNVTLLPLHPPVLVAKEASSLDHLSDGRFILGVAPGGDFVNEFEACGVPHKERGGRTEEGIALLRRLWREPVVDHEGRYYTVRAGTISPKPIQKDGPPVWIGGRGDWAIRCTARLGDAWVPSFMSAARFKQSWERICDLSEAEGRDPCEIIPAMHMFFYIADTFEEAYPVAAKSLGITYRRNYAPETLRKFSAIGSPEDCRQAVMAMVDAGVRYILLGSACMPDEIPEQFERAASALLPLCAASA